MAVSVMELASKDMLNSQKKSKKIFIVLMLLLLIILGGISFTKTVFPLEKINPLSNKFFTKSNLRRITEFISEKFFASGQELPTFFFPHFPQRLMYLTSEISAVSEELVRLNEKLLAWTKECDCEYAESQCEQIIKVGQPISCQPKKVFGSVCPAQEEATDETGEEIIQSHINDLAFQLFSLQQLLVEEMDVGLEKQLETLREEDRKILEENLNRLSFLTPKIMALARTNTFIVDECPVENCQPKCDYGAISEKSWCLTPGQQKPIEMKIEAGVSLEDLELGKVGIKNINVSLPEEIEMPALPELPGLTISIPDITLTCPKETRSLTFHTPTPTLPDAPTLTLGCPKYPTYSSYQCSAQPEEGSKSYLETEWYLQTFSHLSEKCLEVIQRDIAGLDTEAEMDEYQSLMKDCMAPEKVAETIVNECKKKWRWYWILFGGYWYLPGGKPEICGQIGRSPDTTPDLTIKAVDWCKDLFLNQITPSEIPPPACTSAPIETTKQKCEDIRNTGREEPPLSCKLLPLFVGRLEDPSGEVILGQGGECPAQTIGDYPTPVPGCELAFPSVPKISFPKIIIPDIKLPSFSFPPLFYVKLPNFIFEDLVLPDLDLCNLSDCQFQFPYLSFKVPSLKIPEIKVPPVLIDNIPGVPQIEVGVAPIQFPPLEFNFPQLFNLGSLTTPELEIPKIPLPQPKLQLSFKGFDLNLENILLGLIQIPDACFSVKFKTINITYPDYYYGWPAFPRIPEIPFCKDVRQFCKNAKGSIKEITAKTDQIQKQVDAVFQSEIQKKLDQLAISIQEEIEKSVKEQLNKLAEKIRKAMEIHIAKYAGPEYAVSPETGAPMPGVWPVKKELPCEKIPPLTIFLEDIDVPAISLSDTWLQNFGYPFPEKISIPWSSELKEFYLKSPDSSKTPCDNDSNCPQDEKCYPDKKCYKPLVYELPTIPLSKLSYSDEVPLKLPGFQQTRPTIDVSLLTGPTTCLSKPPSGGNPCQNEVSQIQNNLEEIKESSVEIQQSSQNIKDVLY